MHGGAALGPTLDLEERLAVVCGHLNVLHAQLVEIVGEALCSGCWQQSGIRSPAHWLSWQAGMSNGQAQRIVRLAEAADGHPAVIAEFADGAISLDQAAVAASAPGYLDREFAELAQVSTVSQLQVMVRAARGPSPRPERTPDEPQARPFEERLRGWCSEDGHDHLDGEFDVDHGRIIDAALAEARDALFRSGHPDASWAQALVEMAQRSLDGVVSRERRERFRVNWFVDSTDPIPARWNDRLPVPTWLREMVACDGTVAPVFTDAARPVSVGRSQRAVPDRTRRVVVHRDAGRCRVPWCTQTRWLEVHHLVHVEHGGATDTANLIALCPYHHRQHHQGHLGITGNADQADGLAFTNARGDPITSAAHVIRPTGPPPTPAKRYVHPLGERLDRWAVMFRDPPPDPQEPDADVQPLEAANVP